MKYLTKDQQNCFNKALKESVRVVLSPDDTKIFLTALENSPEPTEALLKARDKYLESQKCP